VSSVCTWFRFEREREGHVQQQEISRPVLVPLAKQRRPGQRPSQVGNKAAPWRASWKRQEVHFPFSHDRQLHHGNGEVSSRSSAVDRRPGSGGVVLGGIRRAVRGEMGWILLLHPRPLLRHAPDLVWFRRPIPPPLQSPITCSGLFLSSSSYTYPLPHSSSLPLFPT
jgi:hypothetical protein